MKFNSVEFLIFFIFLILAMSALRRREYKHSLLLCASYYFYWVSSSYCVAILLFTTLITFYCGAEIDRNSNQTAKKMFLVLSLIGTLSILGFFKYFNFTADILFRSADLLGFNLKDPDLYIILPVGISFYTFQALTYVIDIYRGKLKPSESFYEYALYISFFPQLVAGPIVRAKQFLPQLKVNPLTTGVNLKFGITLIIWGMVKKVVIADNIGPLADRVFSSPLDYSSPYIIAAVLLFGIQIYCDFSGYCDIAIGSAKILGFTLPQNFDKPYLAQSPKDFWKKWNITLSEFMRDYLYIPLGGNRKGEFRTYLNLMITMLLCGLWHGAAWNFIIWGGYHGILLMIQRAAVKIWPAEKKALSLLGTYNEKLIKILITQYFIFLGWLIFKVDNYSDLIYCINKYIFIDYNFSLNQIIFLIIAGVFILWTNMIFEKAAVRWKPISKTLKLLDKDLVSGFSALGFNYWFLYLLTLMYFLLLLSPVSSPEFIYFKF
ncbi:MAG: Peptidoglycan O-acetyltransferase [Euryarchaeota archaeon]|nr:Peptidoglycan O-acetyltransferase [Euryarchaeota archaeon]